MVAAKIGFAEGTCSKCGRTLRRRRPADSAACDCYLYCPLCGAKMTPYTPDLTPASYESEKGLNVLYVCNNHSAALLFEAEACGGPFVMKEWERDVLRRTILEILAKGFVHYTDLDKKVCATCHSLRQQTPSNRNSIIC